MRRRPCAARHRITGALVHTRDRGASAVEYALMVAAVAALITMVVFGFGQVVGTVFQDATDCIAAQQQPEPFPNCPAAP